MKMSSPNWSVKVSPMNPRKTLTMSRKEAPRVGLLKTLVAGRLRSREVAEALYVSERHVRRLFQIAEKSGPIPIFPGYSHVDSHWVLRRCPLRSRWDARGPTEQCVPYLSDEVNLESHVV